MWLVTLQNPLSRSVRSRAIVDLYIKLDGLSNCYFLFIIDFFKCFKKTFALLFIYKSVYLNPDLDAFKLMQILLAIHL